MEYKQDYRAVDLSKQRFYGEDFGGQNLSRLKLRGSLFNCCSFDNADMSETDCEGAEFFGSTFRDTVCYRTNFANAKLAGTTFEPKDCMGMTLTLSCHTFEGMRVSRIWFLCWLLLGTMMKPMKMASADSPLLRPIDEDLLNGLIGAIGGGQYVKLRALFSKRDL